MLNYRPEIDGLRAVAVVSVVLFHAGLPVFAGGFVGVDIFFVISGYLITGIIMAEVAEGRFSILRFYERRIRRIMPALMLVLLACLPFAWAWMRSDQLTDFSRSLVAVVFFASNILFWRDSGYFDTDTAEKPLLHTWSLAVEEQFYLFFPLIVLVLWRLAPRRLFPLTVAGLLVSLALSEWASRAMPDANFYLLPTRAWELLAGSLCAIWLAKGPRRGNAPLALAGLVLITVPVFLYDETTRFPGLSAVPVVLGTALIVLFAREETGAARLLALRPMVGIGLISYSAYLWHQPLFAFARIRSIGEPAPAIMAALVIASFVLAWASWRWVEMPFRRGSASLLPRRPGLFGAAALASVAVLGIGLAGYLSQGFPDRMKLSPLKERYFATAAHSPKRDCHQRSGVFDPDKVCEFLDQPAKIAVLGNSHAVELAYALAQELQVRGLGGVKQLSFSGCPPVYETGNFSSPCARWVQDVLAYIAADPTVTQVVVSYRITSALRTNGGEEAQRVAEALRRILADLGRTKKVIYVMQAPELPAPIAKIIQFAPDKAATLPGPTMAAWTERRRGFDELVLPWIGQYGFLNTPRLFCDAQSCVAGRDGVSYYFDDDHMSVEGARLVARALLPLLEQETPSPTAKSRPPEQNQTVAAHQARRGADRAAPLPD